MEAINKFVVLALFATILHGSFSMVLAAPASQSETGSVDHVLVIQKAIDLSQDATDRAVADIFNKMIDYYYSRYPSETFNDKNQETHAVGDIVADVTKYLTVPTDEILAAVFAIWPGTTSMLEAAQEVAHPKIKVLATAIDTAIEAAREQDISTIERLQPEAVSLIESIISNNLKEIEKSLQEIGSSKLKTYMASVSEDIHSQATERGAEFINSIFESAKILADKTFLESEDYDKIGTELDTTYTEMVAGSDWAFGALADMIEICTYLLHDLVVAQA